MRICDRCAGREDAKTSHLPTALVYKEEAWGAYLAGAPTWRDLCYPCREEWTKRAADFAQEYLPQAAP